MNQAYVPYKPTKLLCARLLKYAEVYWGLGKGQIFNGRACACARVRCALCMPINVANCNLYYYIHTCPMHLKGNAIFLLKSELRVLLSLVVGAGGMAMWVCSMFVFAFVVANCAGYLNRATSLNSGYISRAHLICSHPHILVGGS